MFNYHNFFEGTKYSCVPESYAVFVENLKRTCVPSLYGQWVEKKVDEELGCDVLVPVLRRGSEIAKAIRKMIAERDTEGINDRR